MIKRIKHITVVVFIMLLCHGSMSAAKEVHDTFFAPTLEYNAIDMNLRGVGLKRAFFVKAFVAGFYLQEDVAIDNLFENVSKRIEVSYYVSISREKLYNYTIKLMRKNTTRLGYESLKERNEAMRNYFVDLEPGDRFSLTYIPNIGTKFEYNGELIGIIEGEDFADGLFATWLGEKPMDHKLKRKILGSAAS